MTMSRWFTMTALLAIAGAAPRPAAAASCEQLAASQLPDTTIVRADMVEAGAFMPPANPQAQAPAGGRGGRGAAPAAEGEGAPAPAARGAGGGGGGRGNPFATLPSFCRVVATVKPTSDSDIQIEVWMPASNWNGKFQSAGGAAGANSAIGGGINFQAMANSVRAGYATAGTDNGHQGATLAFAAGHPEKLVDFGYRATHEMTVKAKTLIEAFYGNGPRYSYWNACAAGGRQGLSEAQRYPADYDGVVVAAPANNWSRLQMWSMWVNQVANKNPAGVIPAAKYPAIHQAVVEQCDALDGVKDGIIENPTRCHPRLELLACKGEDTAQCLTPAQIDTANAIYAPAMDAQTRRVVYPAMVPGTELGWAGLAGPNPPYYATETFKYLVFSDPMWTPAARPINLGADVASADRTAAAVSAVNPDLSAFFARGGKLIQYHGWTDPLIAPGDSVDYYTSVRAKVGARVDESYRLFMVPGMNHCQGGEGADNINMQPAIEAWVEHGQAPQSVTAAKLVGGQPQRTHLLCPYPQEAVFKGSGSTDEAASFECKAR